MDKNINCVLPWVNLSTNPDGTVSICCVSDNTNQMNHAKNLKNNEWELLDLNKNSIHEIMNSDTYKKVRYQLLNGKWPDQCIQCNKEESKGIKSMREIMNNKLIYNKDIFKNTKEDGSINTDDIVLIELRFSNICNLKCRICSPMFSKKLTNEMFYYYEEIPQDYVLLKEKFWNDIINTISKSNSNCTIFISGGEPFILKKHWDFLKLLIDKDLAKDITLSYNTNCTYLPDYAFDLWSKFDYININLSIDDIGKRCEYLRHGLKWDKAVKNISKLIGNDIGKNISIHPTLTWMSVYYFDEYINFFKSIDIEIAIKYIYWPNYLSPWILPEEIKNDIVNRCKPLIDESKFIEFKSQLLDNPSDINLLKRGITYNKWLDNNRNENFKIIFPELYEKIKVYWNE
jgi:pyruvate-formate lyase-activating enzyme